MMRKIDIGSVLERLFAVYREQFTLLFPAAIIVFLPVAVLNGVIATTGGLLAAVVSSLLSVIAGFWLQGMVIEAVRDIQDGRRDHSLGSLFTSVLPVLPILIGIGFLAGVAIGIGFLLLIVPGLFLATIWAVLAPSIVLERRGFDAFGRSQQLVKGNGWSVFGVILMVFVITFAVSLVLGAILGSIGDFAGAFISTLVSNAITAPIGAIAAAILYLDLRAIKGEGAPHADAGPTAPAQPSGTVGGSPEMPGI